MPKQEKPLHVDRNLAAYMARIRARSGKVSSSDPLVSFLYTLMKDYVTSGNIEEIMLSHMPQEPGTVTEFTNGYLALHAQDIAERIHILSPVVREIPKHLVKLHKR